MDINIGRSNKTVIHAQNGVEIDLKDAVNGINSLIGTSSRSQFEIWDKNITHEWLESLGLVQRNGLCRYSLNDVKLKEIKELIISKIENKTIINKKALTLFLNTYPVKDSFAGVEKIIKTIEDMLKIKSGKIFFEETLYNIELEKTKEGEFFIDLKIRNKNDEELSIKSINCENIQVETNNSKINEILIQYTC